MKNAILRALGALAAWTLASSAWAWADKPVKLIVPAPPGGTMDIVARVLGQQLSADIGQTVIVENRPGAGGGIGNLLAEIPHVIKQPFDPLKDVLPLAVVARSGIVLVASASNPARDFKGLVQDLKARKGKTSYATYSAGTVSHYAGEMLSEQQDLDMAHVPFAGSPPALQNLLGGQVDIMFDGMLTSTPLIKSGKLRPYAFTGSKRSRHLPEVPTMTELGMPDINFVGWVGVMGSAKLPAADVAKIQAALKKAASTPAVQQRIDEAGLEPDLSVDSAAIARETREISDRNAAIVKKYNIKL
jgi:tripartite-type tricarboxylate transporter receptor subunit TctC